MKRDMLKGVLSALRQEDCIIFIGSGISMWSGLPSWTELLRELADFLDECGVDNALVTREIANGELLQAASYGFDKLTKTQIGIFMTQVCRCGKAKPHEIHNKILNLGVKCFITTNYDKLLEMGINKWWSQKDIMVVTNRQLSEMGKIVQARSTNFIYKPHGDVGDTDSIILTREQYRSLLINGERHMALETLRSLMVSRPVVYIGFGLRDPDFIYIRDVLSNIYQGSVRDHYAIMADVEDAEIDYWRRNYGIHLIGYETQILSDGSKSHASLLNLLDFINNELQEKGKMKSDKTKAEIVLALMRYASRLNKYTKAEIEFGICVHRELSNEKTYFMDKLNGSFVEEVLMSSDENAILIGLPGAGKSYAMRRATAILAEKLNEKCLQDDITFSELVIPVYIDLKLYDGNLSGMIEREFSQTLPFNIIISECKCKIFLDSFNEMSREYWEDGKYQYDFAEVFGKYENAIIIIGSRNIDGLEKYKFPTYYLDEMDKEAINSVLVKRGVTAELNETIYRIVSKPFYFQYIINGTIEIKNITQPKHFYKAFFKSLQKDFEERYAEKIEIEKILSAVAYRALDIGIEAFPVELMYEEINVQEVFYEMEQKEEFVNWLIYKTILVPHVNGKITFVHQSITEYLAANKLMRLYIEDKTIISKKIKFYRWDQTIFFMINLLPYKLAEEVIDNLFEIDFGLVLRSVKYIELQTEELVDRIFEEIIKNRDLRHHYKGEIERSLRYDLPTFSENEESIRKIIALGNIIGGSAVFCLWRLKGNEIKMELMQLLLEHSSDYNFCSNAVAEVLNQMIEENDLNEINKIIEKAEKDVIEDNLEEKQGLISAIAAIIQEFDEDYIKDILIGNSKFMELPLMRKEIFREYLQERKTMQSLNNAIEIFMQGYKKASITIYFITCFSKCDLEWDVFQNEHIDKLIDCLADDVWTLSTLKQILKHRNDLKDYTKNKAQLYAGIVRAAILSCVEEGEQEDVFKELEHLLGMAEETLEKQSFELLSDIELVWTNKEDLLIKLLKLKNGDLVSGLMGGAAPPDIKGIDTLKIEDIDWWLNWLEEIENETSANQGWKLLQVSGFLAKYADTKTKAEFLQRFNDESSIYRKVLLKHIIPRINTCLTDFNENAIMYILEDLKENIYWGRWKHHFLANIVDERFVVERLMPLLDNSSETFRKNLVDIIRAAGAEHGKRYIL